MKKLAIVTVLSVILVPVSSCKKEALARPSVVSKAREIVEIREHTGWD